MTKRIKNLNRNKFDQDSGWCLRADYVLWSCLVPKLLRSKYFFQVVLQLSEKKWENLQRHKKYKFENTRFEKFRLSLTKLQESFASSGRFLSVEWTSEDLEHSRICEKITAFLMALPQFRTNFWEDSNLCEYLVRALIVFPSRSWSFPFIIVLPIWEGDSFLVCTSPSLLWLQLFVRYYTCTNQGHNFLVREEFTVCMWELHRKRKTMHDSWCSRTNFHCGNTYTHGKWITYLLWSVFVLPSMQASW